MQVIVKGNSGPGSPSISVVILLLAKFLQLTFKLAVLKCIKFGLSSKCSPLKNLSKDEIVETTDPGFTIITSNNPSVISLL